MSQTIKVDIQYLQQVSDALHHAQNPDDLIRPREIVDGLLREGRNGYYEWQVAHLQELNKEYMKEKFEGVDFLESNVVKVKLGAAGFYVRLENGSLIVQAIV